MSWLHVLIPVPEAIGVILVLITASIVSYYWVCVNRRHYWVGKGIPSKSPPSLFSNLANKLIYKHPHEVERDLYRKFGKVFGSYFGERPMLYVADTELIKRILIKDFHSFSNRRVIVSGKPLHDLMLVVIRGNDQWRNIRNTMTPAFSTGKLKKMLPLISECSQITVDNFRKYSNNGTPVDCKRLFGSYSLDVIAYVAFGTKLDSHNDIDNIFVRRAKQAFSPEFSWRKLVTLLFPKLGSLFINKFFPQENHFDFFRETVLSIMERREKGKEERNDFLQLMIESMKEGEDNQKESEMKLSNSEHDQTKADDPLQIGKRRPLTRDEALAQTILFFVAGFDTTSIALTATIYFLALNPECQRKAAEEADSILQDRKSVDAEGLNEAKYLAACIDEALRLSPPLARLDRTCVKDYILGDTGVTIPAGMVVQIPIFSLHRDPKYFEEPEKFIPERFLDFNKRKVNPFAYLPFGAGQRNCVAMRLALLEVKLCLLHLLKEFQFVPSNKTKAPMEYRKNFLLQPKNVILHVMKR